MHYRTASESNTNLREETRKKKQKLEIWIKISLIILLLFNRLQAKVDVWDINIRYDQFALIGINFLNTKNLCYSLRCKQWQNK